MAPFASQTPSPPRRQPAWDGRKPRVAVLGPLNNERARVEADRLLAIIADHAEVTLVDPEMNQPWSPGEIDLAVVLGGDGSILRAARYMDSRQLPVLGVNLGKLGFLAAISPEQLVDMFPRVCAGDCQVVDHLMFQCTVHRGGEQLFDLLGLNEMAILGGDPFSILNIDLYVDADLATTYSCDGLIISTPVGSTAHSLSAGGPILCKYLQAFVISPISPHTLTVRPVVDTADRVFEVLVRRPNAGTSVVVDGRVVCRLTGEDRVRVQRAQSTFMMLEVAGQSYYETLRERLDWGGKIRGKKE